MKRGVQIEKEEKEEKEEEWDASLKRRSMRKPRNRGT